jgi:cephalosporin hydroxylase
MTEFEERNARKIADMGRDAGLKAVTRDWFAASSKHEYSYHFTWLGRPIIQFPQDIVAMQEIIWRTRPDLIVETGVAHGGALIFYASMLELLGGDGLVLGIDVEIRPGNRTAIESHPLFRRIELIEASSTDADTIERVRAHAARRPRVLVALDSNHTHDHVRRELDLYAPLVNKGSYLVVFDTIIEHMPDDFSRERPWSPGNSPKSAVDAFLRSTDRFAVDTEIENKLQITVAPGGYLKCIAE